MSNNLTQTCLNIQEFLAKKILADIDSSIKALEESRKLIQNLANIISFVPDLIDEDKKDLSPQIYNIFREGTSAYWCFEYFSNKERIESYDSFMAKKVPNIKNQTYYSTKFYVSDKIFKTFGVETFVFKNDK